MAFTEFDTAELPAEYRFDWWREVVARGVAPTRITTDHAADFAGSAGLLDLGRLQFTTMSFPGLRSERTAGLIRRADPETYELALILAGAMRVGQGRNETRLFAGDFAMWTSSRPYSGQAESGPAIGDSRAIILHLPRALVPLPAAKVDRLLAVGIPARSGTGRVLAQFLGSVVQEAPVLDATERERLGGTSLDLATGFLAHHLDAQEYLPPEARHEMLLARVDRFVLDNLSDTRLTPVPSPRSTTSPYGSCTSSSVAVTTPWRPPSAACGSNAAARTSPTPGCVLCPCRTSARGGAWSTPPRSAVCSAPPTG